MRTSWTTLLLAWSLASATIEAHTFGGDRRDPKKPIVNLRPLLGKPLSAWTAALGKPSGEESAGRGRTIVYFKAPNGLKDVYVEETNGNLVGLGLTFKTSRVGKDDWNGALRLVGLWSSTVRAAQATNPHFTNGDLNHVRIEGIPNTTFVQYWESLSDRTNGINVGFTRGKR